MKLIGLLLIATLMGACPSAEADTRKARLFCTNDDGDKIPFKGHENAGDLGAFFYKKYKFHMGIQPTYDPNIAFIVYGEGPPNCQRLPNTMCEFVAYRVDSNDDGSELYLMEMSINLKGLPSENLKGSEMCWRTWAMLNDIK